MRARRFITVTVGRDVADRVDACLSSIADLVIPDAWELHSVVVVDDRDRDDGATADAVEAFVHNDPRPWNGHTWATRQRRGAMANQWDAWHDADPQPGDVIIWVDLDDRLANPDVLGRLAVEYGGGALMTFGSYRSEPASTTCAPATPYPAHVVAARAYREFIRNGGGIRHNHLRTVSWDVLRYVTEADCMDDRGRWWMTGPDMAVMLPALELSGDRCAFIPDPLYVYTSDLPSAEWRAANGLVRRNHRTMLERPPKVRARPLNPPTRRARPTRARPGPASNQPRPPSTMTRTDAIARRNAARAIRSRKGTQ